MDIMAFECQRLVLTATREPFMCSAWVFLREWIEVYWDSRGKILGVAITLVDICVRVAEADMTPSTLFRIHTPARQDERLWTDQSLEPRHAPMRLLFIYGIY